MMNNILYYLLLYIITTYHLSLIISLFPHISFTHVSLATGDVKPATRMPWSIRVRALFCRTRVRAHQLFWTDRPRGKMSTRNNRYEEDYVFDGNTVRRRKQPSLESDNESWGVPALPRLGSKARSDGSGLGGENSRRVTSKRRNRNRRNVPTDDLGRFDHYIRVGLPSQFFYHYNRLLRYELDLIKRFINYTATWSRTEYCMSCCNSKNMFMDISIFVIFIGPVSTYFMGYPQFWRFFAPMILGFILEKLFDKKVKRPYDLDKRLVAGCVTFGPGFPQCDVLDSIVLLPCNCVRCRVYFYKPPRVSDSLAFFPIRIRCNARHTPLTNSVIFALHSKGWLGVPTPRVSVIVLHFSLIVFSFLGPSKFPPSNTEVQLARGNSVHRDVPCPRSHQKQLQPDVEAVHASNNPLFALCSCNSYVKDRKQ